MLANSCIQLQSKKSFTLDDISKAKNTYGKNLYVAKRGKFEALRIGMFNSNSDAKDYMRKNNIGSFAIVINNCRNDSKFSLIQGKKTKKTTSKIEFQNKVISEKLYEENIIKNFFRQKPIKEEIYDSYSFTDFFSRLLREDENLENSYYTNEIAKIAHLIKEDRYSSNIYLTASTDFSLVYEDGEKTESRDSDIDLNWEYRLYDGQMNYIFNQVKKISEQGSQIKYEDDKNKLILLGADLYGNLLFSQTVLNIYNSLYESQENLYDIIVQNRKNGLSTVIDEIDAKYDLLELEKQLLSYEVNHLRNIFLLKQSINSKSNKSIYLLPLNISESNHSYEEEKKLILHNNPKIASANNRLKSSKALILTESGRRMPIVDLEASTGYSWSEDLITNSKSDGTNWDAGITITVPIYERNDIYLNEQRAKLLALQAKNDLKLLSKESINTWDNHKKAMKQFKKVNSMLKIQLKGQKDKLYIVKKEYLEGKSEYKDYSGTLNKVSQVSLSLVNNIIMSEKEKLLGNYLIGKKIYNVKN